jgi:hypothetical protein
MIRFEFPRSASVGFAPHGAKHSIPGHSAAAIAAKRPPGYLVPHDGPSPEGARQGSHVAARIPMRDDISSVRRHRIKGVVSTGGTGALTTRRSPGCLVRSSRFANPSLAAYGNFPSAVASTGSIVQLDSLNR